MAGRILDSSAVAKFYHPELGSAVVEQIVLDPAASILISRLSVVEMQSVFAGKVRSGAISAVDAADLRRRFLADVADGLFKIRRRRGHLLHPKHVARLSHFEERNCRGFNCTTFAESKGVLLTSEIDGHTPWAQGVGRSNRPAPTNPAELSESWRGRPGV